MKARVTVTLKTGILDPQGKAIEGATVFAKLRGNPYVELVHWLTQLLESNETDISVRASVHVGIALGAWRMFTRPGLGFDEGIMVVTNEINRTKAML